MGFALHIREADKGPGVSEEMISLGQALELIVCMFSSRGRRPVQVIEFDPRGVKIRFPVYVGFLGGKPLVQPDFRPGYSGGYVFNFVPLTGQDYDQLMEMLAAYLIAYPELGTDEVKTTMSRIKVKVA